MAFPSKEIRDILMVLATKTSKLDVVERLKVLNIPQRELKPFLQWLMMCYDLEKENVSLIPDSLRVFIRCMASPSPVCSYLFPSDSIDHLVSSLTERPVRANMDKYHHLQLEVPILFHVVKDLGCEVLPECFRDLLKYLMLRAKSPFSDHVVPSGPPSNDKMT